MAILRHVQWLDAGAGAYLSGVSDLVLTGNGDAVRLYSASRFGGGTGGLGAFAVAGDGQVSALNALALPSVPQILGPTRLALVEGWPAGNGMLLAAGGLRAAPAGTVLLGDGQLDKRMTGIAGGPAPDLVAVQALVIRGGAGADSGPGTGVVYGLSATGAQPLAWTVQASGALVAAAALSGAPGASGGSAANLLAATALGAGAVLVAASTAGHRLDSYTATPGAAPRLAQSLGMETGLGLGAPAALEIVTLDGTAFVVVAGMGSSSLTVLRLTADGTMTPLFHAIDTLHSRFDGAAALASATVAGRAYVMAGGGDGGISLFLLLPSGRLLHLEALAWQAVSPGHVTALAMQAVTAGSGAVRLDLFAGGESPGLARLAADLGVLAAPLRAGAAATTLAGGAGNDLLQGGSGAVTLSGGAGDDILIGGSGAAVMTGGPGADLFVPAHNGKLTRITDFDPAADRIDLSDFAMLRDFARIGFTATASGARLTWQGSTVEVVSARGTPLRLADFGIDPLGGLAALPLPGPEPGVTRQGGPGADALQGGSGDDVLWGLGGNDTLQGFDGDDLLIGGEGHDLLLPGDGNDTVWAGPGHDTVRLVSGDNEVWAGTGNDTLHGGPGNDILGGGGDDDLIDARAGGRNQLWGGDGRDTLYASDNGDMAGGGGGDDFVFGGAGADMLIGGLGNDTVHGYGGSDALYLSIGNDMGYGGAGDDTIFAGPGFDQLWGGAGADRFEFYRDFGWNRVEDFSAADGDVLGLGRWMWSGTHGPLTAAQVVQTFGRVTSGGDAVLEFAGAGTTVVVVGLGSLDGLADSIVIL